jgi:hypothetical protein
MGFTVRYQPEGNLIFLQTEGDLDNSLLRNAACEAFKVASEHDCRRFLLDTTHSVVVEGTLGIFRFAVGLEQLGLKRTDWVAVVIARDLDDHRFFENAARNSGWGRIHYFRTLEAATEWLEQKPGMKWGTFIGP